MKTQSEASEELEEIRVNALREKRMLEKVGKELRKSLPTETPLQQLIFRTQKKDITDFMLRRLPLYKKIERFLWSYLHSADRSHISKKMDIYDAWVNAALLKQVYQKLKAWECECLSDKSSKPTAREVIDVLFALVGKYLRPEYRLRFFNAIKPVEGDNIKVLKDHPIFKIFKQAEPPSKRVRLDDVEEGVKEASVSI